MCVETKYIVSNDGARIAYTVTGDGPALLLVHGGVSIFDKRLWVDMKWIERLKDHFRIIAPDIRGNGESDKSEDPAFYSLDNILNDFNAILEACKVNELYYYGWSYGATLGFKLMKDNARIKKAVCAGSFMGDYFFRNTVPNWLKEFEELNYHKKNNSLDQQGGYCYSMDFAVF